MNVILTTKNTKIREKRKYEILMPRKERNQFLNLSSVFANQLKLLG